MTTSPPIVGGAQTISTAVAKPTETTVSARKVKPQLNREDFVLGHMQKFLAHVETRELNKDATPDTAKKMTGRSRGTSKSSSSDDSQVNKDNEDPNAKVENKAD